jgi:hypothetical protein
MEFDIKEGSPVVTIPCSPIEGLFYYGSIRPEKYIEGDQLVVLLEALEVVQDFLLELDDQNKVEYR